MSKDLIKRLRQTRANMLGTDDEKHYWTCHEAASEIEFFREKEAQYLDMLIRQAKTIKEQWRMIKCIQVDTYKAEHK